MIAKNTSSFQNQLQFTFKFYYKDKKLLTISNHLIKEVAIKLFGAILLHSLAIFKAVDIMAAVLFSDFKYFYLDKF